MKRILVVMLVLAGMLLIGTAMAPTVGVCSGDIWMRTDSLGGGVCGSLDDTPGLHTIYILHIAGPGGASGLRFRLETSSDMPWTYVSEVIYAPTLGGDLQSGVTFCYGTCLATVATLAKVTYMGYGTSPECTEIRIAPFPGSNTVDEITCDGTPTRAYADRFYVNDVFGCSEQVCLSWDYGPPATPYNFCDDPLGTVPTTWGAIKSLYH